MAIPALQRLASQISKSRTLSFSSRTIIYHYSATATSSSRAKVADHIVKLSAIDPNGTRREIVGLSGHTLLKALTNHGLIDLASHRLEEIDACSAECEIPHLRPAEYKRLRLSRNHRTVNHAYSGVLSKSEVRERIIRSFLVKEQKIVKKVLKIQKAKEKLAEKI